MLALMTAAALQASASTATCSVGSYEAPDGEILAVTNAGARTGQADFRYTFLDGRRGKIADPDSPVKCAGAKVAGSDENGKRVAWRKQRLRLTPTHFQRSGITFSGLLIEPEPSRRKAPLVVFVGGSEHTGSIGTSYPYIFASQGIATFVYDKRGTGDSGGQYTQDFHVLGADAAAAMAEAKRLDGGRYSRAGFFGGSQGGWVAPLGAYLSHADYVEVGFGEIMNPLEEDAEQVYDELRNKGYGDQAITEARDVTKATGDVMASHFTSHFDELAAVKRRYGGEPWFHEIKGEHTGDVLKTDEETLRAKGGDLYDNLQIDWHYDALGLMQKLNIPQLWVFAGSDREAPVPLTIQRLAMLQLEGKPITAMIFPNTDHGIMEFVQAPDGSRKTTKVADGYFRLLGDWIKGVWRPPYGRAVPFKRTN